MEGTLKPYKHSESLQPLGHTQNIDVGGRAGGVGISWLLEATGSYIVSFVVWDISRDETDHKHKVARRQAGVFLHSQSSWDMSH